MWQVLALRTSVIPSQSRHPLLLMLPGEPGTHELQPFLCKHLGFVGLKGSAKLESGLPLPLPYLLSGFLQDSGPVCPSLYLPPSLRCSGSASVPYSHPASPNTELPCRDTSHSAACHHGGCSGVMQGHVLLSAPRLVVRTMGEAGSGASLGWCPVS